MCMCMQHTLLTSPTTSSRVSNRESLAFVRDPRTLVLDGAGQHIHIQQREWDKVERFAHQAKLLLLYLVCKYRLLSMWTLHKYILAVLQF